ncbi:hypothetical protein Acor_77630 [Acrocarpospora corrugata]|uniref:Uncharacterized protein n=1 Tax=Acrocarpospora corrugata TaxID=35763 RepID=A0A5M3W9D9_9ACTN|nr:hypothetical protein [Acrocarpospora corrugata]GES05695.1 hypothetical protein Acor_77630 [Acrocarpospora corrugata]
MQPDPQEASAAIIGEQLVYAIVLAGLALSNVGRLGPPTFVGAALYPFHITASGGMSAGTVLGKLAETAEHVGEFSREFAAQNRVGHGRGRTADWIKA